HRGEGEGQTFTCTCGHREKLSTFNKRRKREKKYNVSRLDINRYLNNQDDGFKNNALAEALATLKKSRFYVQRSDVFQSKSINPIVKSFSVVVKLFTCNRDFMYH